MTCWMHCHGRVFTNNSRLLASSGALRGGGVKPAAHLDVREDVTHLVVEHDTPFPYQVDGDALGSTTRLEFVHVPDAVKLVVPLSEPASATSPTLS